MKQPRRILLIDGTPGATTILILAAHSAIEPIDIMLIPDTGWYPTAVYTYLDQLVGVATSAAIEPVWVDAAANTAATVTDPSVPCPLPLYTQSPNGTEGQLPNHCATSQAAATDAAVRNLTSPPTTRSQQEGEVTEILLGLGAEHADLTHPTENAYRHNRYPLAEMGWTTEDCRAHLAQHDLAYVPDLACIACPTRGNAAWAELRATDPSAWREVVAVDAALRSRPSTTALGGMPPGTTGYLHPSRVPLADVDLNTAPDAGSEACMPSACRSNWPGTGRAGGGAA